jgi:hypothetical protein
MPFDDQRLTGAEPAREPLQGTAIYIPGFRTGTENLGGSMSLLLIILLVVLLLGGGFGYSRYGAVGGSGIVGTVLIVILVLWLLGALSTTHALTL